MMDAPKSGFALTTCSVIHTDTKMETEGNSEWK